LGLQRVVSFVTVGHHTKTVSNPETDEVLHTVSSLPCSHSPEVVVVLKFHIVHHPGEALSIAIIPCAETSSFLRPQINHFSGVVGWISDHTSNREGCSHENGLAYFVADVIINPE
jgi:hypothetical protein